MKPRHRARLVASLLILGTAGAPGLQAADRHGEWMLMSRHGECETLDTLAREVPGLPDVSAPPALVRFLEAQGHFVAARPLPGSAGRAYQVEVADLSLNLVLVRAALCPAR